MLSGLGAFTRWAFRRAASDSGRVILGVTAWRGTRRETRGVGGESRLANRLALVVKLESPSMMTHKVHASVSRFDEVPVSSSRSVQSEDALVEELATLRRVGGHLGLFGV